MGEQQQQRADIYLPNRQPRLDFIGGGWREGKLARQMKDRRKYYDTWMEGDEACAQLSLWEELLSPPGFSFTNRTISEKNQHRYSMECDRRNVRRLLPAVTSQEKFYESSSQKEGRARSAHGANRISCQSPTCSNSKFLTEGGGGGPPPTPPPPHCRHPRLGATSGRGRLRITMRWVIPDYLIQVPNSGPVFTSGQRSMLRSSTPHPDKV